MYYKELYYKPTANFTARQNNETVSISADEDGFLDGAKVDLENGKYRYESTISNIKNSVYEATGKFYTVDNGYLYCKQAYSGITDTKIVIKANFPKPASNVRLEIELNRTMLEFSTDSVNWTILEDFT